MDLGGGSNTLTLAAGANTGDVSNVNTLIGSTGADTITLDTTASNASISLGGGADTLNLGAFNNIATVANTHVIVGTTGNNTITLGSALTTTCRWTWAPATTH